MAEKKFTKRTGQVSLALKSGGNSFTGFESVHIRRSMLEISGGFALIIENFFKDQRTPRLTMDSPVQVEINGVRVLDGWIDKMPISFGDDNDSVEIHGRDKTCDLVDCMYSFTPNEWRNQSIANLIRNLCHPFDISVVIGPSAVQEVSSVIETYKASEGVTVGDLINELCRDVGIFAMSTGDGKLTLTKAGATRSNDGITVGSNCTAGKHTQSNENRHSDYIVKGQGIGTDNKSRGDYISCIGNFEDPIVGRTRPRVLFSEGITNTAKCRRKAIFEARVQAGLSRAITFNMPSWLQSGSVPWKVNQLVPVKDRFGGIDQSMLVFAVEFTYDEEQGDLAYVSVMDPEACSLSTNRLSIKSRFDG